MHFAAVQPGLFERIVNRCVEPGKPCAVDVMRRDMQRAGGNPENPQMGAGMAPGRESAPVPGGQPVPALEKTPQEKGSGPNVTRTVQPGTPGQRTPGDPRNRDMTRADPSLAPGAVRAGHA
ncbi:COX aromatic rich motif-containing protein [Sphingomonas sp. PR090111-T3T-6A]|uniref:COX aromatic rich motif-containing protein n=1 Tax=Sphingomonas sp. PR090111-T3T-6A TaxID=685778 RepID=UPI00037B4EC7|nr:COX aromatic rich motif-containing protein [Sphingomonas sp. PR090111-T3T-6A]